MLSNEKSPCRIRLVISMSTSHEVGHGFLPWPGDTKEHHNKSAKWHCGRHTLICKKNTN